MDTFFLVIFWLICTLGIGYSILRFLFRRDWPFFFGEGLALSYGTGIAAVSIWMAVMSLFGIRFSVPFIILCFLPFILAAAFLHLNSSNKSRWGLNPTYFSFKKIAIKIGDLTLLEKFFILAITIEVIYAFFRTFIKPMESYDAIAIYALKSKIFYLDRMIPSGFFKDFTRIVPHLEYPLLVPLAETYFYTFLGSLNDLLVKIIFPLYYAALVAVFYSTVARFLNRKASLFFTFLIATIPQITDFATNGYADIPFSFYCSASFFYLYLWLKQKKASVLVLSFILSLFAMWTKAEGLMFALINAAVIIICMIKEKEIRAIGVIYAAISLFAITAYILAWRSVGLAVNADFAGTQVPLISKIITGFKRIPAILYEYQIQFFGPKKWNLIWVFFIIGFIAVFKKVFSKTMMPVTTAIILVLLGYSAVYMLSAAPQGLSWHLSTSGSRLFIHFVPIVVLWLALFFKELGLEI